MRQWLELADYLIKHFALRRRLLALLARLLDVMHDLML
jgi:hypothetical protein